MALAVAGENDEHSEDSQDDRKGDQPVEVSPERAKHGGAHGTTLARGERPSGKELTLRCVFVGRLAPDTNRSPDV